MTIKYYTQSQIDQQASVIGQRLRGITSDLTELVNSSVSKTAPNISSFLTALEKGFNPGPETGLTKDYSGVGWYKATDTGTVFCKDVPELETHVFEEGGLEYVSVHTKGDAKLYGERAATSNVTEMLYCFFIDDSFNQDISSWDVSSVTDMGFMFYGATSFNQDISSWDVSKVTNMNEMFSGCSSFNQDLSGWCVTHITFEPRDFSLGNTVWKLPKPVWGTCPRGEGGSVPVIPEEPVEYGPIGLKADYSGSGWYKATDTGTVFSKDVPALETYVFSDSPKEYVSVYTTEDAKLYGSRAAISNLQNTSNMFAYDTTFNEDISSWDMSNVTDMYSMFSGASNFNQDISKWNVSKVKNMGYVFKSAVNFDQYIGDWNTKAVTNMPQMFSSASNFNQDISKWNVSKVTNMDYMFYGANKFNQDLSLWCVPNQNSESGAMAVDTTPSWTLPKPVWGTCPRGENTLA